MFKFLAKYAKKYWLQIIIMLILTVASAQVNLILPQFTAKIISEGVAMKNFEVIYSGGLQMIGVSLLGGAVMLVSILFASRVASAMVRDVRRDIFAKIEEFSMGEFGDFSVSSLMNRISNDARQIQQTFAMVVRAGVFAIFMGVGAIVSSLQISGSMSWIVAATVVAIIAINVIIGIFAVPKLKTSQKLMDKLNLQTRQTITGLRVIRAFQNEQVEEEKFDKINLEAQKLNNFLERIFGLISPFMTMISGLGLVAIAWFGAHFVEIGEINIGQITSLTQYLSQVTIAFMILSFIFMFAPRMAVSVKRIEEILNADLLVRDKVKTKKIPHNFDIIFENVGFAYPDSEESVLEEISFKIPQGQTVAVIGGTGSGKSTIAKLIPRFYDVSKGKITIGGRDIRDFKQADLRQIVGYAPQKANLFSGSVRSNIAYGSNENLSDPQIIEALKIAQAWDFVQKLPKDLSEKVSQNGKNFSGGQKQRLSIARAIATRAPILIFDDSFSALDYKTDALLRADLAQKTRGQTKFIVAQRVTSIMKADQIIVLDGGKISGIGTHGELLLNNEIYREIASSQLSEEEIAQQIAAQKGEK